MISLVLAGTLVSMPGAHAYRVGVRGTAGTSLVVAAQAPPGWTAAFCSPRICAVSHVPITIAAAGTSYVELHLYPASSSKHGIVVVTAQSGVLRLRI